VGCVFDYNQTHATIVKSLQEPMIEEVCLGRLAPRFRGPALALVNALGAYERPESPESSGSGETEDTLLFRLSHTSLQSAAAELKRIIEEQRQGDIEEFGFRLEDEQARPREEELVRAYAKGGGAPKAKSADNDDDEPAGPSAEDPSGDSSPPAPATA
jgi:hypothetical protein